MSSLTTPAAQPTDPATRLRTTASGVAVLGYAATVYVLFLCVLGYAVGFFAGLGVPKGIDDGPRVPLPVAVGVDLLLLLVFAVQHTVMARPGFKRRWVRVIPASAERATFVLAAVVALALLFWAWRPLDGTVWALSGPAAAVLWATYAAGWALTIASTFLISHSDLVGLRQAWHHARRTRYDEPSFTERGLYRRVRHPLMLGFLVVFWSAPTMTAGHLLFAVGATGYILVGIAFEEHALTRSLGSDYTSYRDRVPALVPRVPLGTASSRGRRQADHDG
ncbi:isoprenylcysteine carboxylmethyltransferase family protein [Fodinibacter luteus]|uniref:methanethiol S-methyltransferase n=1 Tax=Fodinibacter luteus TaxID=552064 RepID=A0ABP8KEB3_9MICO